MSVAVVAHHHHTLPDTPYNLWVRGELADLLHLPNDGTRVEVIGGEIVVSPGPTTGHNKIIRLLERCVLAAELTDPAFQWRAVHSTDLNLSDIHDGYIPDLMLVNEKVLAEAEDADERHLLPEQVDLVIEITSRSNASNDRKPTFRRSATKWNGYAQVGIPYYLLIDRAPRAAQIKLYTDPDRISGEYMREVLWDFGQVMRLPGPFEIEIPTAGWRPWK